jgi:hypothetical protein
MRVAHACGKRDGPPEVPWVTRPAERTREIGAPCCATQRELRRRAAHRDREPDARLIHSPEERREFPGLRVSDRAIGRPGGRQNRVVRP